MPRFVPTQDEIQTRMSVLNRMAEEGAANHEAAAAVGLAPNTLNAWLKRQHPELNSKFMANSKAAGFTVLGKPRRARGSEKAPVHPVDYTGNGTLRLQSLDNLNFKSAYGALVIPRKLMAEAGLTIEDIVRAIDEAGKVGFKSFYTYYHTAEDAQVLTWRPSPIGHRV